MSATILQAIDNLIVAMQNLTAAQNNQNIILTATASASCACIVGQGPDTEAGEEGGVPPPPIGDIVFDDLVNPVDERKCDASDYIVDWLVVKIFQNVLVSFNVEGYAAIGFAGALAFLGGAIGALTTGPAGALVGAVAGLLIAITAALLNVAIDTQNILDQMLPIRQDLICALYLATSVEQARTDFQAVLDAETTLNDFETDFVMLWLPNAILNMLFFDVTIPIDTATFFDGYVQVIGCAPCGQPAAEDWMIAPSGTFGLSHSSGFLGSGTVLNDGSEFVINSVLHSGSAVDHVIVLITKAFYDGQPNKATLTTNPGALWAGTLEITAQTFGSGSNQGRRVPASNCVIGTDNPPITGQFTGWQCVRYLRNGAFTMTFKVVTPPTIC